ncbi:MAG TPA: GGDEF domain-containing protein, partial [Chloroflexota bacterium]
METVDLLGRARVENGVLSEMASLIASDHSYEDLVEELIDLIERVVSAPFLGLSIREDERVGHYVRADRDVDQSWLEAVAQRVAGIHDVILRPGARLQQSTYTQALTAPSATMAGFAAESRSGRSASLILASQEPLVLDQTEEQLMLRLIRQALLVLDHALLLETIADLEVTDDLTGVINHHRLLEILEYEMRRHRFAGKWLAMLMLDVEGLESINRSYGRRYGNHVLQKLAALLQSSVRPIDIVARHGLDEFAVVLPEMTEEDGRRLAEELHQRFQSLEFAGGAIGLTAGAAHVRPDETLTAEAFLRRGEQALHEAKRYER